MNIKKSHFILSLLVLLSLIFKLLIINEHSLWYDELYSWNVAANFVSFSGFWHYIDFKDVHPPLYNTLLFFVVRFFGDSETILKLPSLFAGLLSIPLMYFLTREFCNEATSLISASFMAFMWYPVFYSISVRSYALTLLLVLAYMLYYIRLLNQLSNNSQGKRNFYYVLILGIILSYTHYYGVFLVFLTGIYSFAIYLKDYKNLKLMLLLYLLIFIAFIPWLSAFFREFEMQNIWMNPPHILGIFTSIAYAFTKDKITFIPFLILLVISIYFNIRNFIFKNPEGNLKFTESSIFLILWLTVPFYFMLIKAHISTPNYNLRHFVISLPAAYIIVSYGIDRLLKNNYLKTFTVVALNLFLIVLIFINPNNMMSRTDYRNAMEYISNKTNYKTALLVECDEFTQLDTRYIKYYIQEDKKHFFDDYFINANDAIFKSALEKINSQNYESIWLIEDILFLRNKNINYMKSNFLLKDSASFYGIKIYKFNP